MISFYFNTIRFLSEITSLFYCIKSKMLRLNVFVLLCASFVIPLAVCLMKPDCNVRHPITVVDCNHCRCKQGHLIDCTKFRCGADDSEPDLVCVEREVKQDGCNLCFCYKEKWHCTYIPCENIKKRRSLLELEQPCLEGRKMQHDCKDCFCRDGEWVCSENSCIVKRDAEDVFFAEDLKDVSCSPRDKFDIDCHVCACNPNGVGYKCTESETCHDPDSDEFFENAWKYVDVKQQNNKNNQEIVEDDIDPELSPLPQEMRNH